MAQQVKKKSTCISVIRFQWSIAAWPNILFDSTEMWYIWGMLWGYTQTGEMLEIHLPLLPSMWARELTPSYPFCTIFLSTRAGRDLSTSCTGHNKNKYENLIKQYVTVYCSYINWEYYLSHKIILSRNRYMMHWRVLTRLHEEVKISLDTHSLHLTTNEVAFSKHKSWRPWWHCKLCESLKCSPAGWFIGQYNFGYNLQLERM